MLIFRHSSSKPLIKKICITQFLILFVIVLVFPNKAICSDQDIPTNAKWVSMPVYLNVEQFVPSSYDSSIYEAGKNWSIVTDKFGYDQALAGVDIYTGYINEDPLPLAKARLSIWGDEITMQSSIEINLYFEYDFWTSPSTPSTDPNRPYHLVRIMLHELGHIAGLNHSQNDTTVMVQGQSHVFKNSLHQEDRNALIAKYGPTGEGPCQYCCSKPAIVANYTPGAGLLNWIYLVNVGHQNGLFGKNYDLLFRDRENEIFYILNENPSLRDRANNLAENLAQELHNSIQKGGGYHFVMNSEQIINFDQILEILSGHISFPSEIEQFRKMLKKNEGKSFWDLFSENSYQQVRIPLEPFLSQNSPNPFNPNTILRFGIPKSEYAILRIYNSTGQVVRTLISGQVQVGVQEIYWDSKDDYGREVASGLYFAEFTIPSIHFREKIKMALLK